MSRSSARENGSRRNLSFSKDDLVRNGDEADDRDEVEEPGETNGPYRFVLGVLERGYFKIAGEKLGTEHDIYLASDLPISSRTFIAHRNISIFRHIARVTDEEIYIGGDKPNAMPAPDFEKLLNSFPNSTELDRYADAKVARLLGDYFDTTTPAEKRFEDYLTKRGRRVRIHDIPDVYQLHSTSLNIDDRHRTLRPLPFLHGARPNVQWHWPCASNRAHSSPH